MKLDATKMLPLTLRLMKTIRQPTFSSFDEPAEMISRATPSAPSSPALHLLPPPEELAGKTVYVVDAHSLIYQVFHALPEMSGPSGQPVGAIQGFIGDLLHLI